MADQDGHRLGGASPQPSPGGMPAGQGSPQGSTPFHASGKKLSVDFGEANQALAHLEAAFNELDGAVREARNLSQIKNPGREQPSKGFAGVANPVGEKKQDEILNQREAVRAMYDNLKAQLDSQHRTEQANATDQRRVQG